MTADKIRAALGQNGVFWRRLHLALTQIGFTEEFIDSVSFTRDNPKVKHFKDSVWGMMEFSADELVLIDSPIVQRLRRIHQLGLSFLTYPSAEHSRFSHTLGVAHVVKRLIQSIGEVSSRNTSLTAAGERYTYYNPAVSSEAALVRSLVHAALLHDCGHIAFSHAGESAFVSSAGKTFIGGFALEDFLQIFKDSYFESSLSECLSIAICLSPRFEQFYTLIAGAESVRERINEICCFIGGVPHSTEFPGLANIISGAAVDADKIDYINRDARECGIPVGVDVSRVFLNTALIQISDSQAQKLSRSRRNERSYRFGSGIHFDLPLSFSSTRS